MLECLIFGLWGYKGVRGDEREDEGKDTQGVRERRWFVGSVSVQS